MRITVGTLYKFSACQDELDRFKERLPHGVDISMLWSHPDERATAWRYLLEQDVIRENLGWAIVVGMVPGTIEGKYFTDKDWPHSNFNRVTFSVGAKLDGTNLHGSHLIGAQLMSVSLMGTNLDYALMEGSVLSRCEMGASTTLVGTDLERAAIVLSEIDGTKFDSTLMVGTDLGLSRLTHVVFDHCDMQRCSFEHADLKEVQFNHCNLVGASFSDALLEDVDFYGGDLRHTSFKNTQLTNVEHNGFPVEARA